ncbi:MAG: 4'-phosphopantetheinyl transferase superfamily protein [Oscillospiraceae bacterium]|nr:4'-phosphopantetheinyl transferase superfamily protein [Oscillospiraceae bacterium]
MLYLYYTTDNSPKTLHAIGRRLLFDAVRAETGLAASEEDISFGAYGKPFFEHIPLCFSISHCHGLVCLLTDAYNCGIDAEHVRDVGEDVIERVMHEEEKPFLPRIAGDEEEKLRLWTLKECASKAEGSGLTVMHEMHFLYNTGLCAPSGGMRYYTGFTEGGHMLSLCLDRRSPQTPESFEGAVLYPLGEQGL